MSSKPSASVTTIPTGAWGAVWLIAFMALAAGPVQAQSASSTFSSYRTGYGGAGLSGLESPVNLSLISPGSQYTVSDGLNQAGSVGSVFVTQTTTTQTSSGVGQVATSNERAPVAVMNVTTAADHDGQATAAPALPPVAPSGQGTAAGDLVLNGKINLDGGQ